jgi:hypothetical protein
MKTFFVCFIVLGFTYLKVFAQKPIDQLVAAEKNFANTSREQSSKKAFLTNVDSNCIGFNKGEQLNVFREWLERKEDSSKLTWAPELAVIASAGDMGVTTGPWEYRQKSLKDTPVVHGNFTTVWQKKDNGEWKAMLDLGITFPQKIGSVSEVKKIVLQGSKVNSFDTGSLLNTDKNFMNAYETDKATAIQFVIDKDSWFSIAGNAPLKNAAAIKAGMSIIPSKVQFTPAGMFLSKNNDLFVVYGSAKTGDKKQAFMRLWKYENKGWKLLMMVIS